MSQPMLKAPMCLNSHRYLIPVGWHIKSCPYPDKMRLGCIYCDYYKEIEVNKYYKKIVKRMEATK